jgi:hypothetical protein
MTTSAHGASDGDVYRDAAIDFPPAGSRLLIVIEHDSFLVGSGFVENTLALARLRIEYRPSDKLLEWVLLLRFLGGFAEESMTLEDVATSIHAHIERTVAPAELKVVLERLDGPGDVTYRVVAGR